MAESSELQSDFHTVFSEYMELDVKDTEANSEAVELWNQLIHMIYEGQVTPTDVLKSVTAVVDKYQPNPLFLVSMLDAISYSSKSQGGYAYPEFFWFVIKSGIFERIRLSDQIMSLIVNLSNPDVVRSYLMFTLLSERNEKQRDAIRGFYYVGFTIETLKIVLEIVPMENNLDFYSSYVFRVVMSWVYSERAKQLTTKEKIYLQSFFENGTALAHPEIVATSQKALAKLNELSL